MATEAILARNRGYSQVDIYDKYRTRCEHDDYCLKQGVVPTAWERENRIVYGATLCWDHYGWWWREAQEQQGFRGKELRRKTRTGAAMMEICH